MDVNLFRSALNNPHHTLHTLLPPQSTTSQNYQLRQRVHDRQLPVHLGHLIDKNFITTTLTFVISFYVTNCILSVFNTENDDHDDD